LPTREDFSQFPSLSGWYEVSEYPIELEPSGKGCVYIVRDISDRRLAEMELLRQKQYFEAVVYNSPVAIVILDRENKIVSCNLEEVLPRFVDDRAFYYEMLSEFLQNSQNRLDEIKNTIEHRDGKQLNFLAHRFKGMAANLGAEKIARIAQRLEDCGKQNQLEACQLAINELEMEMRRLEVWFRGMKSEPSTP